MIINLNQIKEPELDRIEPSEVKSISIEGLVSEARFQILQTLIEGNPEIKVVMVVESGIESGNGALANLDVLSNLKEIKLLVLFCTGSQQLDNLNALGNIDSLTHFRIGGNYNKKIDLSPLTGNKGIEDFELEFGLASKNQIVFVNSLENLNRLAVSVIDASVMQSRVTIKELAIGNTIKNVDQLHQVYPNLKTFSISFAKGIDSFEFLSTLGCLEELTIGHTAKITGMPKLSHPENLKSLKLIFTPAFRDVESILQFKSLESLFISEFTVIPIEEIALLKSLKKLKLVYLNFRDDHQKRLFEEMAKEYGWIDSLK